MSPFGPKTPVDEVRKEIEATWDAAYKRILAMQAEIDRLKLEITALKKCLDSEVPTFQKRYLEVLEEIIQQMPPE
jgi:hypothetical protein